MKNWKQMRFYAAAIVLALWAAAFSLGLGTSKLVVISLLFTVAAACVVSEVARKRQREALRKELHRGHRS